MFAVIKTGGKQYKVSAGDILKIEKLTSDAGKTVDFQDVFMIGDDKSAKIGTPSLDKVLVKATVLEQKRDDKVIIYKKKRRQGYDRKNGHRQHQTVVHIDEILEGGKSLAKVERKAKTAAPVAAKKPVAEKTVAPAKKAATTKPAVKKEAATAAKKPAVAKKTTK